MTQITGGTVKFALRWAVPLTVVGLLCTPASPGWAKERREVPNTPPAAAQSPVPDPARTPVRWKNSSRRFGLLAYSSVIPVRMNG